MRSGLYRLLSKLESNNDRDREEAKQLFRQFFIAVQVMAAIYLPTFLLLRARMAFWALAGGLAVFSPLTIYFNRNGYPNVSRLIFILSCNYYIVSTSFGLGNHVSSQYYCLPAMMLGLLLYDEKKVRLAFLGIGVPVVTWIVIKWGARVQFAPEWLPTDSVNSQIEVLNFVGSFFLMAVALGLYIISRNRGRDREVALMNMALSNTIEALNARVISERRAHHMLSTLQEGMVLQDENEVVIQCNPAAAEIFGSKMSEIVNSKLGGKNWRVILPDGRDFPPSEKPSLRALQSGLPVKGVVLGLAFQTGEIKWLRVNAAPIREAVSELDSTKVETRVLCTFSDITDLHREREKMIHTAKLATLGEMSAGVAHEIKNPLAVISGTIPQIFKNLNDPKKVQEKLKVIQSSVERIGKIVNGLKKFSRNNSGIEKKNVYITDLIHECINLTEPEFRRWGATKIVDVRTRSQILCDEIQIEQVIINLINNAIHAVKDLPDRWVRVSLFETDSELVLRVADSGPGISPRIEKNIFQPFFTTKPVGEGTGLGLSICRNILSEHGATISILRDSPNTCFEVRFPKRAGVQSAA